MSNATIIIELIRIEGRLVGRTASDRWNLAVYGIDTLADNRNHSEVKALRRKASKDGITVRVVRGEFQAELTTAERDAWTPPNRPRSRPMAHFHFAAVLARTLYPPDRVHDDAPAPLDFDRSPLDRPGYDHRATVAYVLDAPANFPADYASWR